MPVHEATTLRERKKQRTRAALQAVALERFDERGFDEVTVDEIVELAEVSRSTFFRYFPTKEDVLVGRWSDRLAELQEAFVARPADEPVLRSLRHALRALAAGYEDERSELAVVRRIARDHPSVTARGLEHQNAWEATFAELLADRMDHADPEVDLHARVVAGAVMAAVRVAIEEWMENREAGSLAELLDATFDVLGDGLGPTLQP